ncbi:hypothetical protein [Streptomyces sp. NPDC090057]|uniref:hypothetical protein n=1 Tax=Streptomyces sp. NPDC090057 TaxID=3365935 RepID=UPI0037F9F7AE
MRDKLGRTTTGAAVLALTATGAITGTANAATDVPDPAGAVSGAANTATDAADDASAGDADSTSTDLSDGADWAWM